MWHLALIKEVDIDDKLQMVMIDHYSKGMNIEILGSQRINILQKLETSTISCILHTDTVRVLNSQFIETLRE